MFKKTKTKTFWYHDCEWSYAVCIENSVAFKTTHTFILWMYLEFDYLSWPRFFLISLLILNIWFLMLIFYYIKLLKIVKGLLYICIHCKTLINKTAMALETNIIIFYLSSAPSTEHIRRWYNAAMFFKVASNANGTIR